MAASNQVVEVCYPSDDNAVELGAYLFKDSMDVWGPYCGNGNSMIVAGGSNDFHHKLHEVLSYAERPEPTTLLFVDQHMDHEYPETMPAMVADAISPFLGFNYADFMGEVEKLPNIDQVVYLGVADHVPSTHEYAMDRHHLTRILKDLFIYIAPEKVVSKPDFSKVTPEMMVDPFVRMFIDVLKKEMEEPTIVHGRTDLYLPSVYRYRQEAMEVIKSHPSIRAYEQSLDKVRVDWKYVEDFDPSVIRNGNVWISLDFDVFDEGAGIPTKQDFGSVPYAWFDRFIDVMDGFRLDGMDYWGFEKSRMGHEPMARIREIHERVKDRMLRNPS
jgi:hypothetical protein